MSTTKAQFDDNEVLVVLPFASNLQTLVEINYWQKFSNYQLAVSNFDDLESVLKI
jgi:hypothetical protein